LPRGSTKESICFGPVVFQESIFPKLLYSEIKNSLKPAIWFPACPIEITSDSGIQDIKLLFGFWDNKILPTKRQILK
jgi:hypothetical protein